MRRRRIERDLQGRGYGTLLLWELERRAYQSGVRTLCLQAARRRPLTLQFYRRHGYVVLAQIDGYPEGIVKYLMHKKDA